MKQLYANRMIREKGTKHFIHLKYYKTSNICSHYGIEIIKKDGMRIEKNCIKNITKNKDNINELIDVLCGNLVTPISLRDVMEEIVAKQEA